MKNFFIMYKSQINSYLVAVSLGVLNHFLYELLNKPIFLVPFIPTDESVFEHLKLLFYPILVISIIEGVIKNYTLPSFISSRIISVIISSIFLVLFYYLVTLFNNGKGIDVLNIISYFVFMLTTYIMSDSLYNEFETNKNFIKIGLVLLFISVIFLTFFSWYKPNLDFFIDK